MRRVGKRRVRQPSAPVRPAMPLVLACALGMWASCAGCYAAAQCWSEWACVAVAVVAAVGAPAFAGLLWRRAAAHASGALCCALLGVALGACVGAVAAAELHASMARIDALGVQRWHFELVEDAQPGTWGSWGWARATAEGGEVLLVRVTFEGDEAPALQGERFEAQVRLAVPQATAAAFCWQRGAAATAKVARWQAVSPEGLQAWLLGARAYAIEAFGTRGGKGGMLLQALVCGYRAQLGESAAYQDYKTAGLAHVVAVSGAHLVIVGGFASLLLKWMRVPRVLAVAACVAFLVLYLVFAGVPISGVRAVLMTAMGMSSVYARRRPAPLNALGLCIIVLVACAPATAVSVSFALSAGSTLGIMVLAKLFASWVGRAAFVPRFACDALALTLAASVATTPLSAALFAQVPLVAPVANVAAAPLFALVCAAGLAAAVLSPALPAASPVLSGVASAVMGAASLCASALDGIVHALASIPHASIPADLPVVPMIALSVAAVAALWHWWPCPGLRALAGAAALAVALAAAIVLVAPRLSGDEIIMLDVGQGDAFVIRSQGSAVLVDTGNRDLQLRQALARHGIYRLDAVVVTHADDDHCGSLASLKGIVDVRSVLVARDALACPCEACAALVADARALAGDEVRGLALGDVVRCGSVSLEVAWPRRFADEGGNADSLCLVARADVNRDGVGDWTALLCGDAEAEQLASLVKAGTVGKVDVLKVGHHGARVALDGPTVAALSPGIALVSVGANNRYGHPSPETLAVLEDVGAAVFRTDEQGDVSCKLGRDAIRVTTLR